MVSAVGRGCPRQEIISYDFERSSFAAAAFNVAVAEPLVKRAGVTQSTPMPMLSAVSVAEVPASISETYAPVVDTMFFRSALMSRPAVEALVTFVMRVGAGVAGAGNTAFH